MPRGVPVADSKGMTNVDVAALAGELRRLMVGGRFDKAYQPAKDAVLLRVRRKGAGRLDLLFELGRFVTVTRRPPENPDQPSMVAKILRSTFENARVVDVRQVGFDRLLRIDLEKQERHSLVLELFGDGNLLLLDAAGTIVLPMRGVDHGARRLRKGEPYVPPPGGADPLRMDRDALVEAAAGARGKDLVRFLALDLGFGPLWAEELCLRAGIDKATAPDAATEADWDALHAAVRLLADEVGRNDLAPAVIYEAGPADGADGDGTGGAPVPVAAVPFPMRKYPAPRFAAEEAPTFREALDIYYRGVEGDGEEDDDPRRRRFEEARGRLRRQVAQMEEAIHGFEAEEAERRADGDALYGAYQTVQAVLDQLQVARRERSWQEIAAVLEQAREAGRPEAQAVRSIQAHDGTALVRVPDLEGPGERDVAIHLNESVQDNAARQYEAAKKAKSRQEGAGVALRKARAELAELESRGLDAFGAAPRRAAGPKRHFWFESYRWTVTPSGLLAVGGRNAGQNDAVVKKYLRDGDRYVHAEIHGAPSVVVRPSDGPSVEVPEEDLRVACQFAATSSRAWRQFGAASAYWVTPVQVNKTPRSGEFVPKGAWIVHGRRNVESGLPMRWAVGLVRFTFDGRPVPRDAPDPDRMTWKLVGGPPEGMAPFAHAVVLLEPGDVEPNDAAHALAEAAGVDEEEAQAVLPNGPVRFVDDPGLLARAAEAGAA